MNQDYDYTALPMNPNPGLPNWMDGKQEEQPAVWGSCVDCDWEGDPQTCEMDTEYDEFWGKEYHHPICPECDGGIEVHSLPFDTE